MAEHKILFLPGNHASTFAEGVSFLDAALQLGIVIESSCAGMGTCGKCKVNIKGAATPPTRAEKSFLPPDELKKGARLACQAMPTGDNVCVIPPESQVFGEQIMTEGVEGHYEFAPDLRKARVKLPAPHLGEKYFAFEQLLRVLQEQGIAVSGYDFATVQQFSDLPDEHHREMTAVLDAGRLLAVEAGDTTGVLYGVAVDIGTTTVVAKLADVASGRILAVASAVNPQQKYGADLISRLKYIIELPGGLELLHRLIIEQINSLVAEVCEKAAIRGHSIYKFVVAGNTVMQHIFLNVSPRHLAYKPYSAVLQGPATVAAHALGLHVNKYAVVYAIPNLASFVGGDITSVMTTLDLEQQQALHLVVDIGTNGEMVLGSRERILCASSPAGPAWEGGYIAWGMRAARGAIERAEFVDGKLQIRTIANAEPVGICGSGLMDLVGEFLRTGLIARSGRIRTPEEARDFVGKKMANKLIARENDASMLRIAEVDGKRFIALTQKDIRQVQLAKGAIAAGIKILLRELGAAPGDIAAVYIAGAFGNHVRGQDAVDLGLLPEIPAEKIHFIGNAALSGAEAVLLSRQAREKAEHLARQVEYVEVSEKPDFQDLYVDSMHFAVGEV